MKFQVDELVRLPGNCVYGRVIGPPRRRNKVREWPVALFDGRANHVSEQILISAERRNNVEGERK